MSAGRRHPAKAIARDAMATKADLVVTSGRPTTLWSRLLLQDETGRVTRRSRVPIDVVELDM